MAHEDSEALSDHVRWTAERPQLRRPTLIAAFEGWNDAGDAASTAARHVARSWRCEPVARLDPEMFYDFTSTRPRIRLTTSRREIEWPDNEISAARLAGAPRDVVVLIGTEPQLRWRTFCEQLLDAAAILGVEKVVTLGALLSEVPHSREARVYGIAEKDAWHVELNLAPSDYEGPTGIVGVLSSICREAGYPTASLWSAVPSYMPATPSPKAALALVQRVCAVVEAPVPTGELEHRAKRYETELARMVAEDDEISQYVGKLEKAWDSEAERARKRQPLQDDPDRLVAEVEQFLRDTP